MEDLLQELNALPPRPVPIISPVNPPGISGRGGRRKNPVSTQPAAFPSGSRTRRRSEENRS